MIKSIVISIGLVCLALSFCGCAAPGAGSGSQGAGAAVVQPPAGQGQGWLTVDQMAFRRNVERELDRDHKDYLKCVADRNVEAALQYVPTQSRDKKQDELWRFIGEYSLESFDVAAKKVEYNGEAAEAEIKAVLIVFEKNVVSPKKYELLTLWQRDGDKWLLKP